MVGTAAHGDNRDSKRYENLLTTKHQTHQILLFVCIVLETLGTYYLPTNKIKQINAKEIHTMNQFFNRKEASKYKKLTSLFHLQYHM